MSNTGNTTPKNFLVPFFLTGILYSAGLIYIAYFLQRTDTLPLLLSFGLLFSLCLFSFYRSNKTPAVYWIGLAIFLRLLLLPSIPTLSDDFYRFIWDGRLWLAGEHPFTHLPSWYMQTQNALPAGITSELYQKLNSPNYYTIYPPLNQAVFFLAALLSPENILGSVIVIRIPLLLAEAGSLFLLLKLLKPDHRSRQLLVLYVLNPLVILELTGNLHFEALMIFFLLLALYCYRKYEHTMQKKKLGQTAVAFAAAIGSKLLPLMFLPLFVRRMPKKHFRFFIAVTIAAAFLLFLPLLNLPFLKGLSSSLSLYYLKFEFNAGLYYLLRAAGFWLFDNNIIIQAGPALALFTLSGILWLSFSKKGSKLPVAEALFWAYAIFLLFSLTVHPWYITPLLVLSLFTGYRFPVLWSALVFLTYAGYQPAGYQENLLIVAFEYGAVVLFALWEGRMKNQETENKTMDDRLWTKENFRNRIPGSGD